MLKHCIHMLNTVKHKRGTDEHSTMECLLAVHARLFIWGGNVALHGLITHCTLINFRKCSLHVFYLYHFI